MSDRVTDLLHAIRRVPTSLLFVVSATLFAVLFLPGEAAKTVAVDEFRQTYRVFLGPSLLLFVAWLLSRFIPMLFAPFRAYLKMRRLHASLKNLTAEERGYLLPFIAEGRNTINADMADGVAGGLHAKGIIYRANPVFDFVEGVPYNLQPWARDYLSKHPELLSDAVGEPLTGAERRRRKRLFR